MKLALIFLAAVVVVSHQQFQRSRGMVWLSHFSPRPAVNNYRQPIYYDGIKEDIPFYRYMSPAMPMADSLVSWIYTSVIVIWNIIDNTR